MDRWLILSGNHRLETRQDETYNEYLIPESGLQTLGVPISHIVASQAVASLKLVAMVVSPGGVEGA